MVVKSRQMVASSVENLAELVESLGDVPLKRIRFRPYPGTAREKDVLAAERLPLKRLCELMDGVLVEKAMGATEALLAGVILHFVWDFLEENDLGVALGADGMLRLWPGRVRIPDVSFIAWDRMPTGEFPKDALARLAPDLAVEVLSKSNTRKEMDRKLQDLFQVGTRLVWLIDPIKQSAQVYHSPTDCTTVGKTGALDGEDVLPGFLLPLNKLFARTKRRKK